MANIEIPRPQRGFKDMTLQMATGVYDIVLQRTLNGIDLPFEHVASVFDLYCGNGTLTLGSILAFPNAQIHAMDYHKVLVADGLRHPRVTFHQGWVTETLADKKLKPADIVIMSFASRHHGFTKENIGLLSSHTMGYLLTIGDNDAIENEPWFNDKFQVRATETVYGSTVWSVK